MSQIKQDIFFSQGKFAHLDWNVKDLIVFINKQKRTIDQKKSSDFEKTQARTNTETLGKYLCQLDTKNFERILGTDNSENMSDLKQLRNLTSNKNLFPQNSSCEQKITGYIMRMSSNKDSVNNVQNKIGH